MSYLKGTCVSCGGETSTYHTPQCRKCYLWGKQPTPESIERQKQIVKEYNRQYSLDHKAELRVYKRQQYNKKPLKNKRDERLKRMYGIDSNEFDALYMIQHGRCGICNKFLGHDTSKMQLDHNHKTGQIRLILCPQCNSGLGFFKDNIESLKSAVKYLGGK